MACIDTKDDPENCGECGHRCELLGLPLCSGGACVLGVLGDEEDGDDDD